MSSSKQSAISGKENSVLRSPKNANGKITVFNIRVQPISQFYKKQTLSEVTNFVLQGLKPMDVNTSFDQEVPQQSNGCGLNSGYGYLV